MGNEIKSLNLECQECENPAVSIANRVPLCHYHFILQHFYNHPKRLKIFLDKLENYALASPKEIELKGGKNLI